MEKVYNKLVRDNIPEIAAENNQTTYVRILNNEEFKTELERKLYEEYNEMLNSCGSNRVDELADMIEVIRYLAKLEGVSLEEVIKHADEKAKIRGGFEKKIFLEKVIDNE